jgi:hypothetical protein
MQSPSHIREKCDATVYKDISGPSIEDLSKKIGPSHKMRSEVGWQIFSNAEGSQVRIFSVIPVQHPNVRYKSTTELESDVSPVAHFLEFRA